MPQHDSDIEAELLIGPTETGMVRILVTIGDRVGFDGASLAEASRLVAKVDSAAVQDGFDLYLHGFIVSDDGRWVVVQQGMNGDSRMARRYHWLSEDLTSFVEAPHAAIDGHAQGRIINLTDHRAAASRHGQLDLLIDPGPSVTGTPTGGTCTPPRTR